MGTIKYKEGQKHPKKLGNFFREHEEIEEDDEAKSD